jgi:predicted O-methyltransferase YrrM
MQIVHEDVERYIRAHLTPHDTDVLLEMEALAERERFPIVNRHVGVTLELLTRLMGARRVFELGSGYGYSAFWFARGAGDKAEVHCTDGDAANEARAKEFLSRAGLWDRISYHVGDAVTGLKATDGDFDIVYCDIDKHGYPNAWRAARERIRAGGLYICDNVLWSGRVTEDAGDEWTEAIKEHNAMIAADDGFLSSIVPIRDGVMVALRVT